LGIDGKNIQSIPSTVSVDGPSKAVLLPIMGGKRNWITDQTSQFDTSIQHRSPHDFDHAGPGKAD
jgi:hypothetical protein